MAASSFRADNSILTGSLTEVSPGVPFLNAGNNIEISTDISGQTTINNPVYPTFIQSGLFQNATLSASPQVLPYNGSISFGGRSNLRLHLANTDIVIESLKLRFNSHTGDNTGPGGTNNIVASIHVGNNLDSEVSAATVGTVSIDANFSNDTIYTFDFTSPTTGTNTVLEDQIWNIGIASSTNVTLGGNVHFSVLYRKA